MQRILCPLIAAAVLLASVPAHAGRLGRLAKASAVVAAAIALAGHKARAPRPQSSPAADAETAPDVVSRLQAYNLVNRERLDLVRQNAARVTELGIPQPYQGGLCGPASIYTALAGTDRLPAQSFEAFVGALIRDGNLGSFDDLIPGMPRWRITGALQRLGVPASVHDGVSGASLASRAVAALDDGKLVLATVDAAQSFAAITERRFPYPSARHLIRPIAVQRDERGAPVSIALYDVLVYNADPIPEAAGVPLKFIPYERFERLLGASAWPPRPMSSLVISEAGVFRPSRP